MWRWLQALLGVIGRMGRGADPAATDRSRLMGMYLDQANKGRRVRHLGFDAQQRREGKFSQTRRRL
jgi:hypothetical protein